MIVEDFFKIKFQTSKVQSYIQKDSIYVIQMISFLYNVYLNEINFGWSLNFFTAKQKINK